MLQIQSETRRVTSAGASVPRLFGWGWLILLLATGLVVSSCGNDEKKDDGGGGGGPVGPVYTADELNELGWASYSTGDYYDARISFSQAVELDDALYEAYLGLGWAQAYTGEHAAAIATFEGLITGSHLVNDARAGLAAAALFINPQQAQQAAQGVLDAAPQYVFSRRTTFDYRDLQVILAEAYFAGQQYNLAQATAEAVASGQGLPPSGLDPAQSATWVVDGVTYASYTAALAKVIENLSLLLATHVPG